MVVAGRVRQIARDGVGDALPVLLIFRQIIVVVVLIAALVVQLKIGVADALDGVPDADREVALALLAPVFAPIAPVPFDHQGGDFGAGVGGDDFLFGSVALQGPARLFFQIGDARAARIFLILLSGNRIPVAVEDRDRIGRAVRFDGDLRNAVPVQKLHEFEAVREVHALVLRQLDLAVPVHILDPEIVGLGQGHFRIPVLFGIILVEPDAIGHGGLAVVRQDAVVYADARSAGLDRCVRICDQLRVGTKEQQRQTRADQSFPQSVFHGPTAFPG